VGNYFIIGKSHLGTTKNGCDFYGSALSGNTELKLSKKIKYRGGGGYYVMYVG
jgi:hypothetical protein